MLCVPSAPQVDARAKPVRGTGRRPLRSPSWSRSCSQAISTATCPGRPAASSPSVPRASRDGKATTVCPCCCPRGRRRRSTGTTSTPCSGGRRWSVPASPTSAKAEAHAIRHFFASTALHEGGTIKAVSEYLGHADPGFTLRTYTPDGGQLGVDEASDRHGVSAPLALLRHRKRPPRSPMTTADNACSRNWVQTLSRSAGQESLSRVSRSRYTLVT